MESKKRIGKHRGGIAMRDGLGGGGFARLRFEILGWKNLETKSEEKNVSGRKFGSAYTRKCVKGFECSVSTHQEGQRKLTLNFSFQSSSSFTFGVWS